MHDVAALYRRLPTRSSARRSSSPTPEHRTNYDCCLLLADVLQCAACDERCAAPGPCLGLLQASIASRDKRDARQTKSSHRYREGCIPEDQDTGPLCCPFSPITAITTITTPTTPTTPTTTVPHHTDRDPQLPPSVPLPDSRPSDAGGAASLPCPAMTTGRKALFSAILAHGPHRCLHGGPGCAGTLRLTSCVRRRGVAWRGMAWHDMAHKLRLYRGVARACGVRVGVEHPCVLWRLPRITCMAGTLHLYNNLSVNSASRTTSYKGVREESLSSPAFLCMCSQSTT
jgi:hypothetical protein